MGERKVVARNRRARRDYAIEETYEAGLVLQGSEVKALRAGRVSLEEAYAKVEGGEVWLYGMHIAPYEQAGPFGHDPDRPRKLLLRKREISRLVGKVGRAGYTLVPLSLYFNERGFAKVELALAKGLTKADKRRKLIEEEEERRAREAMKRFRP
ncbi:MAG: SsrA-binding protein SmpB [Candidatus Bipolaricaulota bacterium]|nr:SsrA-binding protein SmpB [Candidatus Bipolaricaulota bacterium]MCX7843858.1 SsrA-binding protein SmpB [Candidatus Bipolaricaulota bacterium]MDW8151440.1 SsrA-binding protein SmpB [Candidatus Bipolaricaulota bacterium]